MTAVFMSHPTAVLRQFLADQKIDGRSFDWGRLSLGLEVMTQIKILETLPLTDLTVQLTSAFRTLLVDAGVADEVEKWYERLDAWRAPRFVSADRPTDRAFGASSSAVAPEGSLRRVRRLRASLLERRDREPDTTGDAIAPSGEREPETD